MFFSILRKKFSALQKTGIYLIPFFLLAGNISLEAQNRGINREKYKIQIVQTDKQIIIDGVLNEAPWFAADSAVQFQRVLPTDTGFAMARTIVRLTYDDENLYLSAVCYDPTPGKRPVESLRKDFNFGKNDNFLVFIDTYNDLTNGFSFGVSAAGAEWDGIQANGGTVMLDWNTKWKSFVKNYPDRWQAEFSIPFRSIRYQKGSREWGINFSRLDLKTNEKSSWAPIPRQFATATLAYTGTLAWDKAPEDKGLRFSLIPYALTKATIDNELTKKTRLSATGGMDAKLALATSVNLDLTVNPDYSQVEVDRQRTNLDRFELFFPEKRQFFLDNSDLFSNLGNESARPFFSRRIGLENPVLAGARLSGNIGDGLRIGLMNMQTSANSGNDAANFSVAALQQKVFSRSNITGFFVNKNISGVPSDSSAFRYNRVAGFEYNHASADNRWTGKGFYHQSFYPGTSQNAAAASGIMKFSTQYLTTSLQQSWVGSDYLAEAGYIRRTGYFEIVPAFQYKFFPNSGRLINHGPALHHTTIFDPASNLIDRETELQYNFEFRNTSAFSIELEESYIRLEEPFDPTNTGGLALEAGMDFTMTETAVTYTSDPRRLLFYSLDSRYGSYFNGTRWSVNGEINYRFQPYGSLTIVGSFNQISLPDPYKSAELILAGPKLDFTFTNKLFLTAIVQYNNQIDNINSNIRFQWRFAPVSDLYIVYTGNSWSDNFHNKNQGLIIKLSYWFN